MSKRTALKLYGQILADAEAIARKATDPKVAAKAQAVADEARKALRAA